VAEEVEERPEGAGRGSASRAEARDAAAFVLCLVASAAAGALAAGALAAGAQNLVVAALLDELEGSAPAALVRQSQWGYPAVEIVHIVGLALVVGAGVVFDLRLLGVGSMPLAAAPRVLLPTARWGFALVSISGLLLFSTSATTFVADAAFQAKMGLLVLAGGNVAAFHLLGVLSPGAPGSGAEGRPPLAARVAGGVSLACWVSIVAAGRLIAY